ncbi:MAG TPA: glycogen debranching protein GlgX, partial [Myxococcota bacterium]|nr:glycogen debranching protein GlgX [Myxococcota bacterium]
QRCGRPCWKTSRAKPVPESEPSPLGATPDGDGVRFALASAHAEAVTLCLFSDPSDPRETDRIALARDADGVFRGRVSGARAGQAYGYRVSGPWAPERGLRFNVAKLLVDPYARALTGEVRFGESLLGDNALDSAPDMPRALVVDPTCEWGSDRAPQVPWSRTVLYELHVKGMTMRHPDVPAQERGRYLGLAAPAVLEHLRSLGVTTLSLLPVQHSAPDAHVAKLGLANYWGYSTLAYFAPDARFASGSRGEQVAEFREMVRRLHAAGFEVLIDVVYNHTAEGDGLGPLYSLRGIDNPSYYRLNPQRPSEYEDFSGCGNALDLRQPRARALALDSLRAWVRDFHVDGFRFDLAPALARESPAFSASAEFLAELLRDPLLSGVKLVAEPWDTGADGYHLGDFPPPFAEWNDRFRDAARRFWRSDPGLLPELATRLAGSQDCFAPSGRTPQASVNFVTCHDGFTLEDLVSFAHKHNEANLEESRDGSGENWSSGWGAEGPSADPRVLRQRERTKRNLIATLAFGLGVPMLSHGDELSRTQQGNNNAYCQDGPLTWIDWTLDERRRAFLAFVREALALRRASPVFRREKFFSGDGDVTWLRPDGEPMAPDDWRDPARHALGMHIAGESPALFLLCTGRRGIAFRLPAPAPGARWRALLSSACEQPNRVRAGRVHLAPHSCLWLESDGMPASE